MSRGQSRSAQRSDDLGIDRGTRTGYVPKERGRATGRDVHDQRERDQFDGASVGFDFIELPLEAGAVGA